MAIQSAKFSTFSDLKVKGFSLIFVLFELFNKLNLSSFHSFFKMSL